MQFVKPSCVTDIRMRLSECIEQALSKQNLHRSNVKLELECKPALAPEDRHVCLHQQ